MNHKHFPLWSIMAVVLLMASGVFVFAQDDLPSTPQQIPYEKSAVAKESPALLQDQELFATISQAALTSSIVGIGRNFEASRRGVDSTFIPPDTMGAVGPNHIVEMINGNFEIFNKTTGLSLDSRSLDSFWANIAGVTIPNFNDVCVSGTCSVSGTACTTNSDCVRNFTFDPRIVYDAASGRWFAASLDSTNPATDDNNIYVARSDTDDPTGDWDGLLFDADTVGPAEFHDYDTLAVDEDGLYICTQDFDTGNGGGGVESCYSIPKADLIAAVPTIANMTRFESNPAGLPSVSGSIQPALDFGTSDGRAALLGVNGGAIVRSNILGADAAGATLGAITGIAGDPGHAAPPAARQPDPFGTTIENVAPRFVSNVFEAGDSLWAVHAVQGTFNNSAIQWYQIDERYNTVLQFGLIEVFNQDFHEPSIAVNEFGHVVVGYTCSGPDLSPSSCVSVGETVTGVTTFESPMMLKEGTGYYFRDFPAGRNRWGDYSATVIDPNNPCTFWTFEEFVAVSAVGQVGPAPLPDGGEWGVQVTELVITPPVITVPGDLNFGDTCVGSTKTETLEVCNTTSNTGPCANLVIDNIESSNGQFTVTEPSSGYPVVISPDFCFPFKVNFTPTSTGSKSAIVTIKSNDTANPALQVNLTGQGVRGEMRLTGSPDFGNVCPGTLAEKTIKVCNVGKCDINVASAAFDPPCSDFAIVTNPFPAAISPDSCLDLVIRFTPTSVGPKSCTLVITSDAINSPISVTVTANTPTPLIDVPPDLCFLPTVIQSIGPCSSAKPFPISNTGICNLEITNVSVDSTQFEISGLPSYPIILEPGHIVGEGDLQLLFKPTALARSNQATISVTYISDPVTGATTQVTRTLQGEGVRTGARVLVTAGGVPLANVAKIQIQRLTGNRNKKLVKTVESALRLNLQTVTPGAPCAPFQYHREYGTVSNELMLLPGSYFITATAVVNGKRQSISVGFNADTCTFNQTITINFP